MLSKLLGWRRSGSQAALPQPGRVVEIVGDIHGRMDLLAALYFGIVISANIRAQQVDDESQVQKETAYAGLGTGVLLIVIYGALSYVGVVSGAIATIESAFQPM